MTADDGRQKLAHRGTTAISDLRSPSLRGTKRRSNLENTNRQLHNSYYGLTRQALLSTHNFAQISSRDSVVITTSLPLLYIHNTTKDILLLEQFRACNITKTVEHR